MTARDRILVCLLAGAAVIAGLWFVAIAPKRSESSRLAGEVRAAEQRRDAAGSRDVDLDAARAAYRRDYATLARLGKALPVTNDTPSLVYQLQVAARRAKVDFRSVHVDTPTPGTPPASGAPADPATGGVQPMPLTLGFEGSYAGLQRLLHAVGGFAHVTAKGRSVSVTGRLLTIDGVELAAGRKGLPHVKAEITATAYTAALPGRPGTTGSTPTSGAAPAAGSTPAAGAGAAGATSPTPTPAASTQGATP